MCVTLLRKPRRYWTVVCSIKIKNNYLVPSIFRIAAFALKCMSIRKKQTFIRSKPSSEGWLVCSWAIRLGALLSFLPVAWYFVWKRRRAACARASNGECRPRPSLKPSSLPRLVECKVASALELLLTFTLTYTHFIRSSIRAFIWDLNFLVVLLPIYHAKIRRITFWQVHQK